MSGVAALRFLGKSVFRPVHLDKKKSILFHGKLTKLHRNILQYKQLIIQGEREKKSSDSHIPPRYTICKG